MRVSALDQGQSRLNASQLATRKAPQPLSMDGSRRVVSWPRIGSAIASSRLQGTYAASWRLRAQFVATSYRLAGEQRSSMAIRLEDQIDDRRD